jgi:acyl-CoA thioester hydrolase
VTTLRERPGVKIRFEYEIFNESGALIHRGETLLAFVDKNSNRPCRPPQAMIRVLQPFFPEKSAGQ